MIGEKGSRLTTAMIVMIEVVVTTIMILTKVEEAHRVLIYNAGANSVQVSIVEYTDDEEEGWCEDITHDDERTHEISGNQWTPTQKRCCSAVSRER